MCRSENVNSPSGNESMCTSTLLLCLPNEGLFLFPAFFSLPFLSLAFPEFMIIPEERKDVCLICFFCFFSFSLFWCILRIGLIRYEFKVCC